MSQTDLRRWLINERHAFPWRAGLLYRGPADFIIAEGEWYEPVGAKPLLPKQCYQNAIMFAVAYGCTYVEGYTQAPSLESILELGYQGYSGAEFVQHAWIVDPEGKPWEVTWPLPGRAYRGVKFHHLRADHCTWNLDASILEDPEHNYPLLQQAWVGEDWTADWKPSEGMLDIHEALQLLNGHLPRF